MATAIAKAITEAGLDVVCQKVEDVALDELLEVDGLIISSATYYGTMAANLRVMHTHRLSYEIFTRKDEQW